MKAMVVSMLAFRLHGFLRTKSWQLLSWISALVENFDDAAEPAALDAISDGSPRDLGRFRNWDSVLV